MNYKIGDKVIIKTLDERNDTICQIPQNRTVIITDVNAGIDGDGIYFIGRDNVRHWVRYSMIKCHANEYYLQQIKEELCLTN